jgi:hypothetical protein
VIPPVIWIPAAFAVGLALVLWGGMSWAYDRGGRHVLEELEADRAARAFRRLPRVPAHNPTEFGTDAYGNRYPLIPPVRPLRGGQGWVASFAEHERQALEVANARPDLDDTSDFTRGMAAMVAEGMAAVDAYLEGWQP